MKKQSPLTKYESAPQENLKDNRKPKKKTGAMRFQLEYLQMF